MRDSQVRRVALCLAVMLTVASATATLDATKNRPLGRLEAAKAQPEAKASKTEALEDMTLPEKRLKDLVGRHEDVVVQGRMAGQKQDAAKPRHDWDVPVMIESEGYPVEVHSVLTDDCYMLEMHRIPYGKHSPPVEGVLRPAVYLQHGLLCSSADWVMGIPEKSLGYILADAGYDVWMGNFRGNYYSRAHCDLDPDKNEFWYFSWDQMAKYDLPAMIDKVIYSTGHSKIHYVGHSMGTTSLMAMANEKPEYGDKLFMANLLAPVAYMSNMKSPLRLLAPFTDMIEWIAEHLGLGEFLPSSWLMDVLAELVCDNTWLDVLCSSVLFLICGYDPEQLNETLLETIVHHTPAGASTFTVLHYAHEYKSAGYHKYDFGEDQNMEIWGEHPPPEYLPENINIPLSLYWSNNDWLADVIDVQYLITRLPNIYDNYEVPFALWNHLDYLWGIDAFTLVYPRILANMARAEAEFPEEIKK